MIWLHCQVYNSIPSERNVYTTMCLISTFIMLCMYVCTQALAAVRLWAFLAVTSLQMKILVAAAEAFAAPHASHALSQLTRLTTKIHSNALTITCLIITTTPDYLHCNFSIFTLRASKAAAQCIVIGPVCGFVCVCVCLWVCYHDNSKLRASILTKLGL